MNYKLNDLPPWLLETHKNILVPRRNYIQNHPFIQSMKAGSAEPASAQKYFSGLMWHLLDFGKHVGHLMQKRDPAVDDFLAGRSEDKDGDTDILSRIVSAFGGPSKQIQDSPWTFKPDPIWIQHDALLRAAIYSTDLPWQVGTAALNVGIESLVPYMIEPLFRASVEKYGVSTEEARWLESRSGEEERQHGENGYWVLARFVDPKNEKLIQMCNFYIDALSYSMAYRLLETGLAKR
jgi:pyrroloquinoline quinone (PQQ) biosynthesis protein C